MQESKKDVLQVMYMIPDVAETKPLLKTISSTGEKIIQGSLKNTAGTGTPMKNITGNAREIARKSNIGDGSKKNGGGGVEAGDKIIMEYEAAVASLNTIAKMYAAYNLTAKAN